MSKLVVVEERGRKFTVCTAANANVEKIRIDDGLISGNANKKCDWVIEVNPHTKQYVFFVELKGSDLSHAIKQLECSIVELKSQYQPYKNKQAHAVCSRIIPAVTASAQVAAVNFKKKHGFLLKWHSQSGKVSCTE